MEMRGGQKEEMRGRDWRLTDKAKGRKNEERLLRRRLK